MSDSANTLPKKIRSAMVELLQARLAEVLDGASQARQAHWNVKGPGFFALHELFDKAADQLAGHADDLAERLVTLGGRAEGTVRRVARTTGIPEFPPGVVSGHEHVKALATNLGVLAERLRRAIDDADKAGDKVTADLFTGVAGELDKLVWQIDAHRRARD